MKATPHPGAGIEITDVDLRSVDDATFAEIRGLFHRHGLLFFRGQELGELDHVALAERFGTINVNRFFVPHPEHPRIALVTKEPRQRLNVGGYWHTDHSYDREPALGSILVARELPARGGDTQFLSTYDALQALPPALRERLQGLRAVHSARHVFGSTATRVRRLLDPRLELGNPEQADALATAVHPAVIRHPLSGREALYVNPAFTVRFEGRSTLRSAPLLARIYRRVLSSGRVARFRWEPGSVAMWDNRATWHLARNDYRGQRRVMHRITLDGGPIEAAA